MTGNNIFYAYTWQTPCFEVCRKCIIFSGTQTR